MLGLCCPAFPRLAPLLMFSLASFRSFGFGGSRSGSGFCPGSSAAVFGFLPPAPAVLVSCSGGASAFFRAQFPSAQVFSASAFPGPASFVRRSAALVRALAAAPAPVWVCWPGVACPAGLLPSASSSACWAGSGSGSWAECAFSLGLGVPVLVFLPLGVQPPASWGSWSAWFCGSASQGWFLAPVAQQASLF